MARLVPARPKCIDPLVQERIQFLESKLDDEVVVFQNIWEHEAALVIKPESKSLVTIFMPEPSSYDPDMESVKSGAQEYDLLELVDNLVKHLNTVIQYVPSQIVIQLTSIPTEKISYNYRGKIGYVLLVGSDSFSTYCQNILQEADADNSEDTINRLLGILSAGSSPYKRGWVTEAQIKWRASMGQTQPLADPPTEHKLTTPKMEDNPAQNSITPPATPVSEFKPTKKTAIQVKYLEEMVDACVAGVAQGKPIYSAGCEVSTAFVSKSDSLLPALLISASELWSPVVVKNGKGGFHFRLKSNPQALLGFEVSEITPSAPLVLFLPIVHLFQTMFNDGEYIMDEAISVFARWVEKHGYDNAALEEIDLKIALSVIDTGE